jgi:SnoaL-like polyketide cyclase
MTETFDIDQLLNLWSEPLPAGPDAEERFRELYTDPVTVNGAALTVPDMVARARSVQAMLADVSREVLDVADAGGKIAVAFRMTGRQVGPMPTAAGTVAPTGARLSLRVIDILTITDGRISEITMVADELGGLAAIGAVRVGG